MKSFFIKKINKMSLVPLFEKLDLGKSNIQSSSNKYNCEICHIVYPIGTLLKRLGEITTLIEGLLIIMFSIICRHFTITNCA